MNFRRYLFDRVPLLLLLFILLLVSFVYLVLHRIPGRIVLPLFLLWILFFGILLYVGYRRESRKIHAMYQSLTRLDQKYLIPELLPKPESVLEEAYFHLLRTSCKSMTEEVGKQRAISRSYKEYMEEWVHEIKTPITAIDLICRRHATPETERISQELFQIRHLVEQVLYYARSEQVEKDYFIKPMLLSDIVSEALLSCRFLLLDTHMALEVSKLDERVPGDEKWMVFILRQILVNAVQYRSQEHPRIRIYSETYPQYVRLVIEDNGIGIAKEDLPRVFDKGFTGRNRSYQASTGLGLYLCRKLCLRLGLDIHLDSVLGKGTRVYLDFPLNSMTTPLTEL